MMLRTSEDVILRRDDYLKLVDAQREAQRIINERESEVQENRMLAQHGHGKAVFLTRDGLEAQGPLPKNCFRNLTLELPCRRSRSGPLTEDSGIYEPLTIRRYEFTGRYICGLPVLEEIA